jgi:hypothetical protein
MLLFIESGRLGNQLFQYAALRTIRAEGERLVLVGFDALQGVFENLDASFPVSSRSNLLKVFHRIRPGFERFMGHQTLVGIVGERFSGGRCQLEITPGRMARLRYCRIAYFQSDSLFADAVVAGLRMRGELVRQANERLAATQSKGRHKVFVHVRRGDYLRWPSRASRALLPGEWYDGCMDRFRRQYRDPLFILCSDDPQYLRERFGAMRDVHIPAGNEYEDFALMCHCDSGILSASAYSWWAAYFVKRARKDATLLAPEFWIGHPTKEWFPIGVKSPLFDYVPV